MKFRHSILIISLFFLATSHLLAEKFYFSPTESGALSATFSAGDTIVLRNGNWHNKSLSFKGLGTKLNPAVFMAETPGKVIFTGSSTLSISGSYTITSGLLFEGTTTTTKSHIILFEKTATNCRLTNSAIRNYNPETTATWATDDKKWISLNGTGNRVDHCYFEGKGNIGTLLVVWLESGKSANHQIDSNHFYKRIALLDADNKELNGQEILRIGDSNTSITLANCIVENNFFEECNGEIEIISNKSCGNIYRNNVFYKNNGMLTLRHGNDCEVNGNYFLGDNISGSGGIRIVGENHSVYNNYFQDIYGSGYRTAVCVVNGKTNSALNEYFQVKNALVAFNTFYNCRNVFNIGYQGGNDLPPISSTVAHNVIYATSTSQTGVQISNSNSEVTWKNNLMYQGKFQNFAPTPEQFRTTTNNLNFLTSNEKFGIFKPTNQSIICTDYKTTDFQQITADIEGKMRPTEKMIGAFEMGESMELQLPTPETIGCSFINKETTGLFPIFKKSEKLISSFHFESHKLTVQSQESTLTMRIYKLNGQLVHKAKSKSISDSQTFSLPTDISGLVIFRFDNGFEYQSLTVII